MHCREMTQNCILNCAVDQYHKASFEKPLRAVQTAVFFTAEENYFFRTVVPKLLACESEKNAGCAHRHPNDWARAGELAGLLSPR